MRHNPLFHGSQRTEHLRCRGVVRNAMSRPATGTLQMIGSGKIPGPARRFAHLDAEQRWYFLETAMFCRARRGRPQCSPPRTQYCP
jgi:hypothetical protein